MTFEQFPGHISPEDLDLLHNLMGDYMMEKPKIVQNRRESVVGRFPAAVDCVEDDGVTRATVFFDSATFSTLQEEYCEDEFTPDTLQTLYVEAGVVSSALRRLLDPRNLTHLETIHHAMAAPDGLSRQILEATEDEKLSDDNEKTLLLALHEGNLVTDTALVNGTRLSMGIVYLLHGVAGEQMKQATSQTMMSHLIESLRRWPLYRETRRIFGDSSREETKRLFTNSLPVIEIAGSFPMPNAEVIQLTRAIVEPDQEN